MCKEFLTWLSAEQTTDQAKGDVASAPPSDNTILDRQTKSLSLSVKEMLAKLNDEDIAQTWPEFYSFGFTHSKFQELIQRTDNLGRDLDKLILIASLDSIELELSKGDIKDAKGNALDDVLGYFFRSIMNNGNYKPQISAIARQNRGKEIREMLKKAEIADAWTWWNSLNKEMRKTIYQGGFPSDDRLLGLYYEHGMLPNHTIEKQEPLA
ncbi:hypothetical protein DQK91_20745 [Oceanidesulfovibrio marinus]|uniref:Uncharacterized protein n=2 Tax=Oceanidesulfovibrio marinus TaxID=370038 RepID=A0A6P1ZCD8_9BACT|nr:hypothetical protein DQK91_20745 [Oceanidesulfovibrio marinus]